MRQREGQRWGEEGGKKGKRKREEERGEGERERFTRETKLQSLQMGHGAAWMNLVVPSLKSYYLKDIGEYLVSRKLKMYLFMGQQSSNWDMNSNLNKFISTKGFKLGLKISQSLQCPFDWVQYRRERQLPRTSQNIFYALFHWIWKSETIFVK